MKVYVLTKKSIIVYGAYSLIALFVIYFASYGISVATSSSNRLIPIYNVDTANKQIAITFDAAWGADDTDEIISIFKEHNAKATFFVLGEWVDKYPECVKAL
ncbi:MAG: polysaccharide deacetylase family protein, partial [Oscillospiraceae bacterium]